MVVSETVVMLLMVVVELVVALPMVVLPANLLLPPPAGTIYWSEFLTMPASHPDHFALYLSPCMLRPPV